MPVPKYFSDVYLALINKQTDYLNCLSKKQPLFNLESSLSTELKSLFPSTEFVELLAQLNF
ncbi:hypothetical protein Pse7367_0211 [Thalassoporum mexicanum PCC 7367]|nr:hypothetical protein Pse7367_0211 [Pseudanabaena sp. PCC 7367]